MNTLEKLDLRLKCRDRLISLKNFYAVLCIVFIGIFTWLFTLEDIGQYGIYIIFGNLIAIFWAMYKLGKTIQLEKKLDGVRKI